MVRLEERPGGEGKGRERWYLTSGHCYALSFILVEKRGQCFLRGWTVDKAISGTGVHAFLKDKIRVVIAVT